MKKKERKIIKVKNSKSSTLIKMAIRCYRNYKNNNKVFVTRRINEIELF